MTGIEWTDRTWNPVTGCTKVSPGCDHCYAEGIARRFAGGKAFPNGFDVTLHEDRVEAPLRWRKPSRVFVNSMSDLFHDAVPDLFITRVFDVMEQAQDHTFQVLTKRHGRMRSFLRARQDAREAYARAFEENKIPARRTCPAAKAARHRADNPPSNIWVGVSVEDQKRADLRIPALLDTPAAVRFLSCEPLLGPVELAGRQWLPVSAADADPDAECPRCGTEEFSDRPGHPVVHRCGADGAGACELLANGDCRHDGEETGAWCDGPIRPYPRISWVIVGGESGPGARPMEVAWARPLVEQCRAAGVPAFVKQLGKVWAGGGKGGDPDAWPEDLRVREFPQAVAA